MSLLRKISRLTRQARPQPDEVLEAYRVENGACGHILSTLAFTLVAGWR